MYIQTCTQNKLDSPNQPLTRSIPYSRTGGSTERLGTYLFFFADDLLFLSTTAASTSISIVDVLILGTCFR